MYKYNIPTRYHQVVRILKFLLYRCCIHREKCIHSSLFFFVFITALPIHRYRLQWSLRPDIHLDEFISLQVRDKRLKGTIHKFTISNLQPNRTYVLELQAICRYENRRLRSKQVTLRIQTPTVAEGTEGQRVSSFI